MKRTDADQLADLGNPVAPEAFSNVSEAKVP
jgi:hypothetical protein